MSARKPPSMLAQYRALLAKDLRHELRTRDLLLSMGLYAVLILIVFGATFAQSAGTIDVQRLSGGLAWTMLVFTSLLGLARSFSYEREGAALEGVLLCPVDRSAIYLAKFTTNLIFLLVVEVVVLPLFHFLFLTSSELAPTFWWTLAPLALGTIGITAVGTLLAGMTAGARGKEVLLAILFVPVAFPLLYSCAGATTAALVGTVDWWTVFRPSIILAGAYDIVMVLASWVLYDFVV